MLAAGGTDGASPRGGWYPSGRPARPLLLRSVITVDPPLNPTLQARDDPRLLGVVNVRLAVAGLIGENDLQL